MKEVFKIVSNGKGEASVFVNGKELPYVEEVSFYQKGNGLPEIMIKSKGLGIMFDFLSKENGVLLNEVPQPKSHA